MEEPRTEKEKCLKMTKEEKLLRDQIYDIIATIKDPEKPYTLEELDVVQEDLITVRKDDDLGYIHVMIKWIPTVPHCHLALTIALCMRAKIEQELAIPNLKIDIIVEKDKHQLKKEIDKQVNDKERYSAALEKEEVMAVIEELIDDDY
ncbi:unnamed protein product [Moneuplotes crassus]|uniref:MIP18 family-like domain-containing protein n=1 Tax=Euplotes crassus TaxID=5936 RepID=A0AAD1XZF9_EUPCR|nr:unnamed protein product [Moneuplotes crassus]